MAAYHALHGSYRRNGRVDVEAVAWRHFERIVLDNAVRDAYEGAPQAMLVDGEGIRRAIVYGEHVLLVEPYGARVVSGISNASGFVSLEIGGLLYGATYHFFDGTKKRLDRSGLYGDGLTQFAASWTDCAWATLLQSEPMWSEPKFVARFRSASGLSSEFRRMGRGIGALAGPRRAFVIVAGELLQLDAAGSKVDVRQIAADLPNTVDIAVIDDRPVVSCPRLRELRTPQRVSVAFEPSQPPIDGGDGQIYACGRGIAAVADGAVRWQKPANLQLHATSLGPGGVLVAGGRMLRHYDRDGNSINELLAPDGSKFCTPPAPGPDGSLHVGTTSGAFVIR